MLGVGVTKAEEAAEFAQAIIERERHRAILVARLIGRDVMGWKRVRGSNAWVWKD